MAVSSSSKTASTSAASARQGTKSKNAKSVVGAPSQRAQSTRKGKKAWRKNIDIDEVEEGLEELRVEERVTGSALYQKKDEDLFSVDVKGDEQVRKSLRPRFSTSQLTYTKILQQRSAVPAVVTHRTSSTPAYKRKLSHEEKDRLLRMAKKARKGPFNAIMDHTEFGAGSALLELSEAAKQSGGYDVWTQPQEEEEDETAAFVPKKAAPKKPEVDHPKNHIAVPAVRSPHEGTSYNPPVAAHTSLLQKAVEAEEKRVREEEELKRTKERIERMRKTALADVVPGLAPGMTVQEVVDEEGAQETGEVPAKKIPERKTKAERKKAEKLRAEKRLLAERAAQKRMLAAVPGAKALRKHQLKALRDREAQLRERHAQELKDKLAKGLAGQRLGKHTVPEGDIDVQLGEDLAESLRTLKPEGNLFKDRFLSMQQRALIEPRVPVLPKRKAKLKEYEKHAWKKFDREQNAIWE
ncbi:Nop53 domain-containing protein [Phanerochaete sordida]|uniref:Ribosome biogenesis protein NOP53 n=1 Tax=Phanerochaete sordida TaxID=48140 RepID=A0A9P3L9B6_9APHY|nr:Nop53 domain-containing protein [Phanerochaete sordida]